jgi:hypothetical protein
VILDDALQARRDNLQQLVPGRMSQRVVDRLEPIEPNILDGDALARLGDDDQGIADAL